MTSQRSVCDFGFVANNKAKPARQSGRVVMPGGFCVFTLHRYIRPEPGNCLEWQSPTQQQALKNEAEQRALSE